MSTPRQPVVGDVVHYLSRGSADGVFPPVCRAAVVTEVQTDFCVSLAVLNPTGLFFDREITNDRHRPLPGGWHWPEVCHDPRAVH